MRSRGERGTKEREFTMWGDDPDDYRAYQLDRYGLAMPDLPTSEKINDDWIVEVEWVFSMASRHPVGCVATSVRFAGEGLRECPQSVQDDGLKMADRLFARYREHVEASGPGLSLLPP